MNEKLNRQWSNYIVYAFPEGKVLVTEESGDFSKTTIFETSVDELKGLEKHLYKNNKEEKYTLFFGISKKKNRLLLTKSVWGEYISKDNFGESKNTYFMISEKAYQDIMNGVEGKQPDGSDVYRRVMFHYV